MYFKQEVWTSDHSQPSLDKHWWFSQHQVYHHVCKQLRVTGHLQAWHQRERRLPSFPECHGSCWMLTSYQGKNILMYFCDRDAFYSNCRSYIKLTELVLYSLCINIVHTLIHSVNLKCKFTNQWKFQIWESQRLPRNQFSVSDNISMTLYFL